MTHQEMEIKIKKLEKRVRELEQTKLIHDSVMLSEKRMNRKEEIVNDIAHDINVTISMRVPTNSFNHVVADDVKRLLISNGYDVKHVNVQLVIPIGD